MFSSIKQVTIVLSGEVGVERLGSMDAKLDRLESMDTKFESMDGTLKDIKGLLKKLAEK